MPSLDNPAVPQGSTVLVIGANGLLGSHIADQFLEYGYKVRGTVRDAKKNAWLQAVFDKKYGEGSFELFEIADLTADRAFEEAVKGTLRPEKVLKALRSVTDLYGWGRYFSCSTNC